MTTPALATPVLLTDPGYLLWAPLGTVEPVCTVAGGVFTDAWTTGFVNLGSTVDGSSFKASLKVEAISVAEFLDPIKYVTTGRESQISFALASYTAANLKKVFNGGTLTVTGSAATTKNEYTPPAPGTEVRAMIGWESLDHTVRIIAYQAINSGDIQMDLKKAPAFTGLPCDFMLEVPASGVPYKIVTAGATR